MNIPQDYLAAIREAQRRLEGGDFRGAVHIGEQLVAALPKHPGVHLILARAYRGMGDTERALARFRSSAELSPKEPGRWFEFVSELLKAGQKGRARSVAQKAPLKGPDRKKLLDLIRNPASGAGPALGGVGVAELRGIQALLQQGRPDEARRRAEALLKTFPESAALSNLAGIAALAGGDFPAAEGHFVRTLDLSPDFVGAAANLGLALVRGKKFGAAISVLDRAVAADPNAAEARKNLAVACLEARAFPEAARHAGEFLKLSKDDPDALKILAAAESELKRYPEALAVLDRLEKAKGRDESTLQMRFETLADAGRVEEAAAFAEAHMERSPALRADYARLLAQLGDVEEARSRMARMVEDDPDDPMVYYRYGLYTRWREDDPMLAKLRAASEKSWPDPAAAVPLFYALSKAQFDLGLDDAGFASLDRANELQGRGLAYDFDAAERQRQAIQERWGSEKFERLKGAGDGSVAPIFVVGPPRSGSTLVEHVIAAHPDVTSIGEDSFAAPYFPLDLPADPEAVAQAAREGAEEIRRLSGPAGRLLDKYLHNFWRLGALAAAFPKATFVEMRRDPRAVAFSIYSNLMGEGHSYATDLGDIAGFWMNYRGFMEHWRSVLGERVVVAEYERIVGDPEPEIRSLIGRLGLPWDDACLRPEAVRKRVKTLSVAQVRSGIHSGSAERWRRYEAHLAPFTEALARAGWIRPER